MNKFSTRQLIDIVSALDAVVCASVGLQIGSASLHSMLVKLNRGQPEVLIQQLDMILRAAEQVTDEET